MANINPVSKVTTFIGKLFDSKKFLVAFSLLCAIVFWLIIDITENPSRDVTFSDIALTVTDQVDDDDRVLTPLGEYTKSVSVTVSGPGYIVSTVSKDDISVSVKSYAEVSKPGTYVLTLTATVAKNDCEVVSISPSYIQVVYDYNTSTEIPVEIDSAEYQQYLGEGCEIDTAKSKLRKDGDRSEISSLAITGPSEVIAAIEKVVAKPIITGAEISSDSQIFNDVSLTFYDALGNVVDSSALEYDSEHHLSIVVFKRAYVNLIPTFVNIPDYYAQSESGKPPYVLRRNDERARVADEITQIEVKGPADKVDLLIRNGLELAPIDFTQIDEKGEYSFLRSFVLDEGVEIVDGTEEIIVELDFGGQLSVSKEFSVSPSEIKLINTGGKAVEVNYTGTIKVTLCGNSADIKKIKAADLTLIIDCNGGVIAENGEDKLITVSVSSQYRAWMIKISKEQVQVVIK